VLAVANMTRNGTRIEKNGQFVHFVQMKLSSNVCSKVTSMSAVIRDTRSRRREPADAPRISASAAKNGFGRILDRVAREGPLAITKHDEPCAVLISIGDYRALIGAKEVSLNSLTDEFDALFERMQEPGALAAMQKAFTLTPAQLGRAAVKSAAGRASSKGSRRARG
jgi:prevent-host-death family protein